MGERRDQLHFELLASVKLLTEFTTPEAALVTVATCWAEGFEGSAFTAFSSGAGQKARSGSVSAKRRSGPSGGAMWQRSAMARRQGRPARFSRALTPALAGESAPTARR